MTNEEIVERRKGMSDRDYTVFARQVMAGRTIKSFEEDGYGLTIVTTDGLVFEYSASDGGYSQSGFSIEKQNEEG